MARHDEFGDSTWDNLGLRGWSTYAAALAAGMWSVLGEQSRVDTALTVLESLWNRDHHRACSEGKYANAVIPDSLLGAFYADIAGAPFLPRERIARHPRTAYETAHLGYHGDRFGPLLIAEPGTPRYSMDGGEQLQTNEVLLGPGWMFTAMLHRYGLRAEAVDVATRLRDVLYGDTGLQYRSPASVDADGHFRAPLNMRPLAVWWLEVLQPSRPDRIRTRGKTSIQHPRCAVTLPEPELRTHPRSAAWFQADGKLGFVHRSKLYNQGRSAATFDGRPVIGICNSWSELTPCNAHLRQVADSVKRGVLMAGGEPFEFPTMSLGETLMRPTAMLFRNLMSMDVEESLRAYPLDGVVLLAGCDKTVPAQLMGAISADLPMIMVTGGPMLNGKFRGCDDGSGTHVWQFSEQVRAGQMSEQEFSTAEACLSRSSGHCTTMGTASTMACLTETLGLSLPGSAAVPAVDADRYRLAEQAGTRVVSMVREGLCPSRILDRRSFENAARVNAAIAGSTNAIVHLSALAGRSEIEFGLDEYDTQADGVPLLVDLLPSGRFLMEEFAYAGGLPAVIGELGDLLHGEAWTVTGHSIAENNEGAPNWNTEVVHTRADPVLPAGNGTVVLHGDLAPDGAVLKVSAASPELLDHTGPALVFDTVEEYYERVDEPQLPVTPDTVLIVRGAGPVGYPGMPEIGNLAIPKKLLDAGVRDVVRITDGRMSGTSYGTVVLHVAPESAVGGPLALVRSGDVVHLDVLNRRLDVTVGEAELAVRRESLDAPASDDSGGYAWLYRHHVGQADTGADFGFLRGKRGHAVPRRHL